MSIQNRRKEQFSGRGAVHNPHNRFVRQEYINLYPGLIDEEMTVDQRTEYIDVYPKTIVNEVVSPDIPGDFSMNPYQGCEHGCLYCYARPTHEYWGYSGGLDFERKILIKRNAAELLEKAFLKRSWKPSPIMFSGNTDCYQPIERELKITRSMLEVCLKYAHPVSMITKNALVIRDLDILSEMAKKNLVSVMISITTLDEDVRRKLEPRTSTSVNRLKALEALSSNGIPCGVMTAPVIPGLNSHEMPEIIKQSAESGAVMAGYTILRLNGVTAPVFESRIRKEYPDRAIKIISQVAACHGGSIEDRRFGKRMSGEGKEAQAISRLFKMAVKKYMPVKRDVHYDTSHFEALRKLRLSGGQINLFDL